MNLPKWSAIAETCDSDAPFWVNHILGCNTRRRIVYPTSVFFSSPFLIFNPFLATPGGLLQDFGIRICCIVVEEVKTSDHVFAGKDCRSDGGE